jgi:prolyl-tRNA synthetase
MWTTPRPTPATTRCTRPTSASSAAAASTSARSKPTPAPSAAPAPTSSRCSPTAAKTPSSAASRASTPPTSSKPSCRYLPVPTTTRAPPREQVATPDHCTIAEVSKLLDRPATDFVKTLIVDADGALHAVLLRGDHDLNEIKLRKLLGAERVELASDARVVDATGAPVGFAGPVDLKNVESLLADHAVHGMRGAVVGANIVDAHFVNIDEARDFSVDRFADLRMAADGDPCPRCDGTLKGYRGIEVGHVFFLGTKYSEPMKCNYLDESGREQPMVMGCYGIGVTRVMAAAIEQNHDEHGIIWPLALAPYQVTVLPLQMNKTDVVDAAEKLYAELAAAGVEVLIDDRNERAGSKFADAELMGIPLRIAVGGRGLRDGLVELKTRGGDAVEEIPLDRLVDEIRSRLS